ncbi:hypothetical protein CRG98_041448 [Punica granatum]|uniref:AIPP2-like SPOC-like domain-containing protein n=1 Tax=Punica granatum TaxID=22663 RepID=A0A2I0I2I8_PUNGR|nr:hypothetical protein CRG98_041448 [Punica granatum]
MRIVLIPSFVPSQNRKKQVGPRNQSLIATANARLRRSDDREDTGRQLQLVRSLNQTPGGRIRQPIGHYGSRRSVKTQPSLSHVILRSSLHRPTYRSRRTSAFWSLITVWWRNLSAFLKVLSPAAKKFARPSMSQEVHMRADSVNEHSLKKDNDCLGTIDDRKEDATSVNSSKSNGSPKQRNLPKDPTSDGGLHPEGNGKANRGAEVNKNSTNPARETSNSSNEDEKEEKSVDRPDLQDSPIKSVPCNDSEDSNAMEQDVKVCDICGDAGREDLLAICCRCTDGAEHTYCMREMLQKVPEGDWLCEECKLAEESTAQKSDLDFEEKSSTKAMQVLGKRPAEDIGVARAVKKQALEVNARSPRMVNLNGTAASSRNSSFKNMDKGKGRASHDNSEMPLSPTAPRNQASKNALLKSKSFSALTAKSKVKQEEGFPQKPRGARSNSLLDTKIGPLRTLGKSASFKHVNQGRADSPDSKVKIYPAKFSNVQELKGASKHRDEQNPADRSRLPRVDQDRPSTTRNSPVLYAPKLDQKPSSRSDTHSLSSASDSRDSNIIQSDGKPGSSLSKSASYVARRGTDGTVGSGGSSSSDGGCNTSIKKRSNHIGPKGGNLSGLPSSSEKLCSSGTGNIQDVLTRARESRNHVEKTQESSASRFGKAVTSGSRTLPCEKCDEFGHTAEVCLHGSSQACDIDVTATKFVRGDMTYGSKSTVPVTSAMLKKPGIYRRNKALDRSDNLSVPNAPATQEQPTFPDLSKKSENVPQLNGVNEAIHSLKAGALESKAKPVLRELPALWNASIIPEHDCIWQGGFQVYRGSKLIDLHGGFQAHLSTCVSPKVLEMVTKFPDKIALNEVPRVSSWPIQFRESGTKEDHIALYFFAQDLESYERNYRGLLENMMNSDLALKGDLGSAELLIFPSNQLPEKSQRWNMSFYLWGVFKGSRANVLDSGLGEGEGSRKKQKTDNHETSGCNSPRDASPSRDGFAHQVHDLNECSAVAENLSGDYDNGVALKGTETAERFLFPVSFQDSKELMTGNISIPWKSASSMDNEVRCHGGLPVPDLELALGAETKSPGKGISFLVEQSKPSSSDRAAPEPKENEDDDPSASLSLSLSFPFPDEERRSIKPSLPKEKLLQEGTL